jgi:hypothetical protein
MWSLLWSMYDTLLLSPLRQLYLYGPVAYNMGFWQGKDSSEICQMMTNHNQLFWVEHHEECQALIETRFQSFKTTVEVLLYFTLMYKMVVVVLSSCSAVRFCTRPRSCLDQIIYVPVLQKKESALFSCTPSSSSLSSSFLG